MLTFTVQLRVTLNGNQMNTIQEIIQNSNLTILEKDVAGKYGHHVLYEGVEVRPVTVIGDNRMSRNYRSSKSDHKISFLKGTKLFDYETGNDAPRGGKPGEYHKFTPKKKRLGLKRKIEALEQQQRIEHQNKIDREKKEIDIAVNAIIEQAEDLFEKMEYHNPNSTGYYLFTKIQQHNLTIEELGNDDAFSIKLCKIAAEKYFTGNMNYGHKISYAHI